MAPEQRRGRVRLRSVSLSEVSLVDAGDNPLANVALFKRRGGAGGSGEVGGFEIVGEVAKVEPDRMLVFGWAYVSVGADGMAVIDHSGEELPLEELEAAAYAYMQDSREGSDMHSGRVVSTLVESVVFTPEKVAALGLDAGAVPHGWWVGFKVNDPVVWEAVKSGVYKMFSIGGSAVRDVQDQAAEKRAIAPAALFGRADVVREVERVAREEHPALAKRSIAAARSEVWRSRPNLAERYAELPPERPAGTRPGSPALKGSGALEALDVVADELIKRDPSLSRRQARIKATKLRPDLRDLYHESFR